MNVGTSCSWCAYHCICTEVRTLCESLGSILELYKKSLGYLNFNWVAGWEVEV